MPFFAIDPRNIFFGQVYSSISLDFFVITVVRIGGGGGEAKNVR